MPENLPKCDIKSKMMNFFNIIQRNFRLNIKMKQIIRGAILQSRAKNFRIKEFIVCMYCLDVFRSLVTIKMNFYNVFLLKVQIIMDSISRLKNSQPQNSLGPNRFR